MTADELKRAKLTLDGYASGGETDVLQARMRVHKLMREQGIPFAEGKPAETKPEPSKAQSILAVVILLGILVGVGSCGGVIPWRQHRC